MNQLSEALNQQGMAHFDGDFEKAKKFFALAIAQQPFDAKYYHNHGRKNLSTDRFADALADFSTVMRLNANDDDSCHYLGVAYFFLGMYDLAIEAFMESIRLMIRNHVNLIPPTVDWAWMAYMRKGDPKSAAALLEKYIYPEIPCGADDLDYKMRALLYMGALTVEDFIKWIPQDDVDGITCWYGIANYYHYVHPDAARYREALERTLAFKTVHNAFAYKLAAQEFAALAGDDQKTTGGKKPMDARVMELEAYLKQNPTEHKKWFELGQLYFDDEFEKARDCFSMAIAQEPFNVEYRFNRGRKCLSLDKFEEALADFAWSVRLDSDDGFKWHYLANAHFFLGMYEQAIEGYQRAIECHTKNGRELVPPAIDWIWMAMQRMGKPEEAKAFLLAHTYPEIPVEESDLDYKNRILLYAGLKSMDEYMQNDIHYDDALDAITELYGIVNYYKWVEPNREKAIAFNDQVLAYKEAHACFAYKLALKDRAKGMA